MRLGIFAGVAILVVALCFGAANAEEPAREAPIKPPLLPIVQPKTPTDLPPLTLPVAPAPPTPKTPSAKDPVGPPPMSLPDSPPGDTTTPFDFLFEEMPSEPSKAYARAEYLFWFLCGGQVPPLATTGPAGIPISVPGFPGSTVRFGDDNLLQDPRSGLRIVVGSWLDCTRTIGVEASGFWLNRQSASFVDGSADGSLVLASSPFTSAFTGLPSSFLVSAPGIAAGSMNASYVGRSFWGAEGLMRYLIAADWGWRLDALVGVRYRSYNEALDITSSVSALAIPGFAVASTDGIRTTNDFAGAVLGVDCQKDFGSWTFNLRPTVGLGRIRNTVTRTGTTTYSIPGMPDLTFSGGTYNLDSNIGQIEVNDWSVIPELDIRVTKTVWNCVRLSVGYSALYFASLARAGEQIDTVINPNLLPPAISADPLRPAPFLDRNGAWLQGLTVGLEVRF